MTKVKVDGLKLVEEAKKARLRAYVPYSQFKVGAALLDEFGHIHYGCNVENAAYGPSNCAERTAFFRAIADGCKPASFVALAVVGDTEEAIAPCGVCRQVMIELCDPQMPVYLSNLNGKIIETTVEKLLPGAFDVTSLTNNKS